MWQCSKIVYGLIYGPGWVCSSAEKEKKNIIWELPACLFCSNCSGICSSWNSPAGQTLQAATGTFQDSSINFCDKVAAAEDQIFTPTRVQINHGSKSGVRQTFLTREALVSSLRGDFTEIWSSAAVELLISTDSNSDTFLKNVLIRQRNNLKWVFYHFIQLKCVLVFCLLVHIRFIQNTDHVVVFLCYSHLIFWCIDLGLLVFSLTAGCECQTTVLFSGHIHCNFSSRQHYD